MNDVSSPLRKPPRPSWLNSLSFRLFAITVAAILLVELLIFIPSAASFRSNWIMDRVQAARTAALALEAAPSRMVSAELSDSLLLSAEVLGIAELDPVDEARYQLLPARDVGDGPMKTVRFMEESMIGSALAALGAMNAPDDRTLLILAPATDEMRTLEILVDEAPLQSALADYGWRIFGLSLLVSMVAGALIFGLLYWLVVRPMQMVTSSVEQFRDDPGGWTRTLPPTKRRDEIGRAQNALADMEEAVAGSFRQRERLAELGEAVAKINHDLRGSLAVAQMVSDSLTKSEDPRVQRAAPRLERALERAIGLATQTLEYGKAETPEAHVQEVSLFDALEEAAAEGLAQHPGTEWANDIPPATRVSADPEHLHRIISNLIRNAAQAMDGAGEVAAAWDEGSVILADTGPGLPQQAQDNLFKPFAGSAKQGGTGLGLVIARDLARSMGGDLELESTGETGTVFRIVLGPSAG